MTFEYFRTEAGSRLVNKTLPELVAQIGRLNDVLERYLAPLAANRTGRGALKPRAVVYTRKRGTDIETLSVDDQRELCRAYLLREGWTVEDEVTDDSEFIDTEAGRAQEREAASHERR